MTQICDMQICWIKECHGWIKKNSFFSAYQWIIKKFYLVFD